MKPKKILWRRSRLTLPVALALAWVLISASPTAIANETSVVSTSGATLSLSGSTGVSTVTLSAPLPAAKDLESVALQISTPSDPAAGASNVSVQDTSSTAVWDWAGNFGQVTESTPLNADNSTAATTLALPPGQVVSGSAVIQTTAGALRAPYNVSLNLGGSPIFSRSSTDGFEPFQPLDWGNQSSAITAEAAYSESNGSEILVLGDQSGYLTIYETEPPGVGIQVYQSGLAPPNPVEQIVTFPVKGFSQPEVAAISGDDLFVLLPLQGLKWDQVILTPPVPPSGVPPQISELCEQTVEGLPSIFVALSDDIIAVTNDTGFGAADGWQNPLDAWTTFSQPVSSLACATTSSGLSAIVAVAVGSQVELGLETSTSLGPLATISLPGETAADALSLADGGQELLMAATDGELYAAQNSTWQAIAIPEATQSSALTCVVAGSEPGQSVIATCDSAGRVEILTDPFSGTATVLATQSVPGLSSTPILGFGSLYGDDEADAITNVGNSIFAAANDYEFREAGVPEWIPALNSAIATAIPTTLSTGASVESIPLSMESSGGGVALQSINIGYNATQAISLATEEYALQPPPASNSGEGVEVSTTWKVMSATAGLVHLSLVVSYLQPTSPSTLQTLDQWFVGSWIFLVAVMGGAGVSLLLLGRMAYWKPAHKLAK